MRKTAPEPTYHDPREEVEWFQRLPDYAKERVRRRWQASEGVTGEQVRRRRRSYVRYAAESAGVFAFVQLWPGFPWMLGLEGALVGAGVGLAAARLRAGHFLYVFLAGIGYLSHHLLLGGSFRLFGYVFLLSCFGVLGVMHRLHRADGTES